ncbi:MAG: phosphoglycerate mutase family protein [Turicibacter sp.]|nr:phosphoglycerate mutase family protein [Turicibacter sp.]
MKQIFLVRHCETTGQSEGDELTSLGFEQARGLAGFLADFEIHAVVSSPFVRAIQSITPFCNQNDLTLRTDDRLVERVLGLGQVKDFLELYQPTFVDLELRYGDGETSKEALQRILAVIEEVESGTVLVSHGGLLSLALMHYGTGDGFQYWEQLGNPDVFLLTLRDDEAVLRRLWK